MDIRKILITISFSLFLLITHPNIVKAACGTDWFCGIDQGYEATFNMNAKKCDLGANGNYACVNNGLWSFSGTRDCKNYAFSYTDPDTGDTINVSVTSKYRDCSVSLNGGSYSKTYDQNIKPIGDYESKGFNSCAVSADLKSCTLTRVEATTSCCVCSANATSCKPGEVEGGGGGGCDDPNDIDVPDAICSKTGFYGKYAASRGVYAVSYQCDPDSSEGSFRTCDGWNSTWDGYWNIPSGKEGDYEFRIAWNPVAKFRIDTDLVDNGFDDGCPSYTTSPVIGTYYYYLASGIPILRENSYRPRWLNDSRWGSPLNYIANGAANCESVPVADRDGKGIHLEKADVNTAEVSTCPSGGPVIDTAHQASATTECPVSALTIASSLDNNKSTDTKDDWLTRGAGFSYFTRNMTAGPHKVQIYYLSYGLADQPLDISYRRKIGSNWTAWVNLKDLSDVNCPISPCKASCTISLTPTTISLIKGGTQSLKAVVNNAKGTVEKVHFSSNQPSNVGVNPADDSTAGTTNDYYTTISADNKTSSPATVTAEVYINGFVACKATRLVTVNDVAITSPWWQVKDGDVITRDGDLITNVVDTLRFLLPGDGGYPGVPWYGKTSGTTDLTGTTVSDAHWIVQDDYSPNRLFSSTYFFNALKSSTETNTIDSNLIEGSVLSSGGTRDASGYYYYIYDGSSLPDTPLTINSAVALGTRKVVLFVKNADVNIKDKISLQDGSGFFMIVTTGDIDIDPSVGAEGANPDLEGIYVADGHVNTGTDGANNDNRLYIRGTVVSGSGVKMERDRGVDNNTLPSEYIEFAIDQELLFPEDLSYKPTKWQEVAP